MKKILLTLMICLLLIPTTILVGCKDNKNNGIDLSTYFENKVTYQVSGKTAKNEATLKDYSHNKHNDQVQYTNITFTGKPAWLYKMTLEKITFDIFSNENMEDFQIKITISNLKQGDSSLTTTNTLKKEIPVKAVKNKAVKVELKVNDIFNSMTASTTIKIEVDSSYYTGDNKDLNFKFDLMNFRVYGEHKK